MQNKISALLISLVAFHAAIAGPCKIFEKVLPNPEIKERLVSVLKAQKGPLSYKNAEALKGRDKKHFQDWLEKFPKDLENSKGRSLEAGLQDLSTILYPKGPKNSEELADLHLNQIALWSELSKEMQPLGLHESLSPQSKKWRILKSSGKALGNALQLSLGFQYKVLVPFFQKMNLRVDPSDPAFNQILQFLEEGKVADAKLQMYRVFQREIPFVRDPVKLEHVFNRLVHLVNKKILALGILGLRLYILQTTFNESARYEVIQETQNDLQELDAEKREFFLEQLEALGIDPKEDAEAYRDLYKKCFGQDLPEKSQ